MPTKAFYTTDYPPKNNWKPCTFHGFSQETCNVTMFTVAIVEDDKTGDIKTIKVQCLRFKNPE